MRPLLLAALLAGCAAAPAATVVTPPPVGPPPAVVSLPPATATTAATSTPPIASAPPWTPPPPPPTVAPDAAPSATPTAAGPRPDGLDVTVLAPGTGPAAQAGDQVVVNYVGMLLDGTQFDSTRTKGRTPFRFVLGKGTVIKGWEEGVVGMQIGEVRRLILPPELAYGERGRPPTIPARATLVFEIEMLVINPPR